MRALILLLLSLVLPVSSFAAHAAPVKDDLSLIELPVKQPSDAPMVIFLSGDGGWAALDKGLSTQFQLHGMPVVGWSSLTYYWKKKNPEQVTADLERILDDYQTRWQRPRWLLVGFSFGAEIVPFVINRLPEHYRQGLVGAVMLSPSTSSDFEIHVSDMLTHKTRSYPTEPQVKTIRDLPMLCLQGADDDDDDRLCPRLNQPNVTTVTLPGGHHFDDNYPQLYQAITKHLNLPPDPLTVEH
ncbi:AcvB/VirJ family lysyl-phosphatidylglycerol hydrolase [Aeromonas sp. 97A]|uniref:AcvB/VirJ family lysyl-phosphatidylglycerol hydrolase n=1 Tax=Aeromonas sp. 97A TaxID=3452731 RepID=UPI003F79AAC8